VSEQTETVPRPRVRAGAIAWGLIVLAIGVSVLSIVGNAEAREGFAEWLGAITPAGFVIGAVLALGAFILLVSGLSLIRRAQRREQRRE
jgi:hypothetical protein